MKIAFDINGEIDRIETGNTVYVAGLYGSEFKFINNKFGIVKNIYIKHSSSNIVSYVADVELFETKKTYPVNFDFIYKITTPKVIDNVVQHLCSIDNPMIYYVRKKNLTGCVALSDEFGQYMAVCNDRDGKPHLILFSNVN